MLDESSMPIGIASCSSWFGSYLTFMHHKVVNGEILGLGCQQIEATKIERLRRIRAAELWGITF